MLCPECFTQVLFPCSWNVKEIHQAADYLKVEEVVTKCKIKMEDFAFIANPSSTETSSITGNVEMNQQTCLLTLRDYNNREEKEDAAAAAAELVQPQAKKAALEKKSPQPKKRKKNFSPPKSMENKSLQYQNELAGNTSFEMFLDANKLATHITEQAAQGSDNSELQLAAVVESETLAAQDILAQTMAAKQKRGKPQQSCALKEHCMSNIASDKGLSAGELGRGAGPEVLQGQASVQHLWEGVLRSEQPPSAHEDTQRGEALRVPALWEGLHPVQSVENACKNSHR